MGTSGFAACILEALLDAACGVVGVYTQPDRAAGRGLGMRQSDVKRLAYARALPVFQPENFRGEKAVSELAALRPDFLIVASYGLILPQTVLDIPAIAPVNVHASLLPAYRGAAPIQYAIMDSWRDNVTGVSIMRMEKGMDTGPVYAQARTAIDGRNYKEMDDCLATLGAKLLLDSLPGIAANTLCPLPQDAASASYADKLRKEDGNINWHWPSARVDSLVRAVSQWPGARTTLQISGKDISVILERGQIGGPVSEKPGAIKADKNGIAIACDDNWYILGQLRPEGRKQMDATAFINGLRCGRGVIGQAV